jgi:peptidyl-prolyl cis-trans isomerase A (cyclophilin A)
MRPPVTQISRRAAIAGAGAMAAAAAGAGISEAQSSGAQSSGTQTPPAAAPRPRVAIETAAGLITIELAADKAPVTCANFLRYVDARKFDGQAFYRAMKVMASPPTGLDQAGADPANRFPPIAHESTMQTGLTNREGAVSMARSTPNSATADFFICMGDLSSLDANPFNSGDNQGFAVFGRVVEGMDVAKTILSSPVSPTKGEDWGMKGQILDPEIKMTSVKRV